MRRSKDTITNGIAGTTKQVVGEIIGDQALHEEGKKQRDDDPVENEPDKGDSSGLNAFDKLNDLT